MIPTASMITGIIPTIIMITPGTSGTITRKNFASITVIAHLHQGSGTITNTAIEKDTELISVTGIKRVTVQTALLCKNPAWINYGFYTSILI